jgi:ParB family chromosome partitioning protein
VLKLPKDIQQLIESEKVSFGHARALLGVNDPMTQRRLAQKIVKHNWSVRETERRVRFLERPERASSQKRINEQTDPNVRAAETKLRRILGTQVRILPRTSASPGRLEIEYYDSADLDRLFRLISDAAASGHTRQAVGL